MNQACTFKLPYDRAKTLTYTHITNNFSIEISTARKLIPQENEAPPFVTGLRSDIDKYAVDFFCWKYSRSGDLMLYVSSIRVKSVIDKNTIKEFRKTFRGQERISEQFLMFTFTGSVNLIYPTRTVRKNPFHERIEIWRKNFILRYHL